MNWIIFIIVLVIIFIHLKLDGNAKKMALKFKKGNVIVFGTKGSGKDLIFQKVISKRKKEPYNANIPYGYNYTEITLNELSVAPNTFEDFIDNKITKIPRIEQREKTDAYISDGGVYLPSQYDTKLSKLYPSLPIFYALSRQLYSMNIHINTQALNRVWVKLREQADFFYKAIDTYRIFGILFTKVRYYETYQSAEQNILPLKKQFMNKNLNNLAEQYYATHGEIKDFWICQRISKIKYDTRHFKKVLFQDETPQPPTLLEKKQNQL